MQDDTRTGKLIPFTEKTLERCKEEQKLRKPLLKDSKFNRIILPEVAVVVAAYHSKCFKYFNAIKEKWMV